MCRASMSVEGRAGARGATQPQGTVRVDAPGHTGKFILYQSCR